MVKSGPKWAEIIQNGPNWSFFARQKKEVTRQNDGHDGS